MQTRKPGRVVGVDVARGVAVIAMICAHLTYPNGLAAELLYGYPAGLFAFIAGVSMGLMARGSAMPLHFAVRGALVAGLGALFGLVPTSITIVLGTLGVCMTALARAPWWPSRWLAVLTVALTGASGLVAASPAATWPLVGAPYPLFMWAALMAAGLLAERHVVRPGAGRAPRLAAGAAAGAALWAADVAARWYAPLPLFLTAQGHTGGVVDVVGTAAASLSICSLCCLISRRWQVVLPRVGAMPLTLYCLHIATASVLGPWTSVAGACAIATCWLAYFPSGPVEAALRWLTQAAVCRLGANRMLKTKEKNNEVRTDRPRGGSNLGAGGAGTRDGKQHVRG